MADNSQLRAFISIARQSGVSEDTIDREVEAMLRKSAAPQRPGFGFHPSAQPDQQPMRTLPASVSQPAAFPEQLKEEAARRSELRTALGIGIPTVLAAPLTGTAAIVAGTLGTAGAEGIDYLLSPKEERPTALGAGARIAAQAAIPYAIRGGARLLAPLGERMQPILSPIAKVAKESMGSVGSAIKTVSSKILGEYQASTTAKQALMAELQDRMPAIPVQGLVEKLRSQFLPFAGNEAEGLVNELYKRGGGPIPELSSIKLDDLQQFVREAYGAARSPAAKQAVGAFYKGFLDTTYEHLAASPNAGPVVAQRFLDLTEETGKRLRIAEAVDTQIGQKGAVGVAQRFSTDANARAALIEMDKIAGTNLTAQIDRISRQAAAAEQRAGEISSAKAANAALASAQRRARAVLYTITGLAAGGRYGLVGGAVLGRMLSGTAIPLESAVAHGAAGAAAIAPELTAAGLQETK